MGAEIKKKCISFVGPMNIRGEINAQGGKLIHSMCPPLPAPPSSQSSAICCLQLWAEFGRLSGNSGVFHLPGLCMWCGLCDLSVRDALMNAAKTQFEASHLSTGPRDVRGEQVESCSSGPAANITRARSGSPKPCLAMEDKRRRGQSLKGGWGRREKGGQWRS